MRQKLVMATLIGLVAMVCMGAALTTYISDYQEIRTASTCDDTTLDGATASYTYQFADKPSNAVQLGSGDETRFNGCQIYFYGTDAATEDSDYQIWAWRKDGPAKMVCYGTATLGSAVTGATNTFYADTVTSTDVWPTDVTVSGSGDGAWNSNPSVASVSFDLMGYEWIYVQFTDSGETAATMSAAIAGY